MANKCLAKVFVLCVVLGMPRRSFSTGLWQRFQNWSHKTGEDAQTLSDLADRHSQLSSIYHDAKGEAIDDIRAGGKTVPTVLSIGAGLLSLFSLARGKTATSRALGAVASGCIALATYVTTPALCKKNPEFAAHLYPGVAVPCATRKVLQGAIRTYCWFNKVNAVSSAAATFGTHVSNHHEDTKKFMRDVCGW